MRNVLLIIMLASCLAACESKLFKKDAVQGQIDAELKQAAQARARPAQPDAVISKASAVTVAARVVRMIMMSLLI